MAGQMPIGDKGNISPSKGISGNPLSSDQGLDSESTSQNFQNLVGKPSSNSVESKPSPMNVAQSGQPGMRQSQASAENFVKNAKLLIGQMKGLQGALQTPNLKLNARTNRLLDAKLKRTKDHINYISSKVNVGDEDDSQGGGSKKRKPEEIEGVGGKKKGGAVSKFINYLTDGQSQLESAMHQVSHLHDKKDPGLMMSDIFSMQVKLYRAQVEIEFSSAVLQKAIDDLKTLMSVQL